MDKYPKEIVQKSIKLRKAGLSYGEISTILKISKSTASLWLRYVNLNKQAKQRLINSSKIGLHKSIQTKKMKKMKILKQINQESSTLLSRIIIEKDLKKLLCSMLYWAEGAKDTKYVTFINSDPKMISTFLSLLRSAFHINENKFRALVHLHEYHNKTQIKKYWSSITLIPLSQFNRNYTKPHTKKRIREGYKGCVSIRYYDYKIALELRSVYNSLIKHIGA